MNLASAPLNPVFFSFFIAPMSDEMGWSLGAISLAITFRLVCSGMTAPIIGAIIDRYGPRFLGMFSGLVAGGTLIGLYYTRDLWLLYLLFALSGAVGLGGGPGGNLLTMVPVAKWFTVLRGRAMSIAITGMAMGTVISVPIGQWLIHTVGWREAWVIFGVAVMVIMVPLSFLFLRGQPSDLGLEPDGAQRPDMNPNPEDGDANSGVLGGADWTAREALRHPVSWLIISALVIGGFALAGTLLHRVAYWEGTGMPAGLVALGTIMDPLTVVFAVLVFGVLGEKVKIRYLGLIGGLGFSLSMVPMILSSGQAFTIFAHNMIWASAGGAYITANNLIWPNYFGRSNLGRIRGIVFPVQVAATGLGAPVYGFLLDGGVDASTLWLFSMGAFITAGFLLFLARPPVRDSKQRKAVS